jgi:hypothetical protein
MLVLPAHNEPFERMHVRLDQLRDDHMDKLDKLLRFCQVPRTVFETFPVLFHRPVGEREVMLATGEARAHLHWLEAKGLVLRVDSELVDRFIAA